MAFTSYSEALIDGGVRVDGRLLAVTRVLQYSLAFVASISIGRGGLLVVRLERISLALAGVYT
jgi:hypothetical protein